MAIASPALQGYVGSKFRIRGLNPIGTAIGAGLGIGTYLYENWEFYFPGGGNIMQPPGRRPGVAQLTNGSPSNASSYKQY